MTAATVAMAGCAMVGPDYERPEVELPARFREGEGWRRARPRDHEPRGQWWRMFGDATLNRLEEQAAAHNPGLEASYLRAMQARTIARGVSATLLPSLDLGPSFERRRTSGTLRRSEFANEGGGISGATRNFFSLPLDASWEIDLWGKVRRSIEAARAESEAADALLASAQLSLAADLAQNYFALRSVEAEIDLLESAVALRREARDLVRKRFEGGATNELDVARSDSELAAAESDVIALQRNRAVLIDALATQTGQAASSFRLSVAPLRGDPPRIPAGVPADLLERRPDVAEAERRMAGASARIGVAKAAFFPSVRLTGSAGFGSAELSNLLKRDSLAWAFGPSVNMPIFGQIVNKAIYDQRKLEFEESVAEYRGVVLSAIQEVESNLSALRLLREQSAVQARAVTATQKALELSANRYREGLVSYLEAVDAERTRLQALRLAQQLEGQRFLTTVRLIKALGGGWERGP